MPAERIVLGCLLTSTSTFGVQLRKKQGNAFETESDSSCDMVNKNKRELLSLSFTKPFTMSSAQWY